MGRSMRVGISMLSIRRRYWSMTRLGQTKSCCGSATPRVRASTRGARVRIRRRWIRSSHPSPAAKRAIHPVRQSAPRLVRFLACLRLRQRSRFCDRLLQAFYLDELARLAPVMFSAAVGPTLLLPKLMRASPDEMFQIILHELLPLSQYLIDSRNRFQFRMQKNSAVAR